MSASKTAAQTLQQIRIDSRNAYEPKDMSDVLRVTAKDSYDFSFLFLFQNLSSY